MPEFKIHKGIFVPESERARQEELDRPKITCDLPQNMTGMECETCKKRYIAHCPECKQHLTGCGCDLQNRINSVKDQLLDFLYGK